MARKDTMKALINRDVSEETAALLLTKYNSLSAISAAGESELIELGLMEEEARSVLAKIGKRPSSSSRVKKEVAAWLSRQGRQAREKCAARRALA